MKKKLLIILGPTATGKTDLAINIAKKLNGELIACDSRQIYKGLDLGSGKYPNQYKNVEKSHGLWRVDGVAIHLYDLLEPQQIFSAADFAAQAKVVLKKMSPDKLPILVGGGGLYIRALLSGLSNQVDINPTLREHLESESLESLQKLAKEKNVEKFDRLNNSDKNNKRRLVRQLEVLEQGVVSVIEGIEKDYETLKVGLTGPRDYLYQRVNDRVDSRLESGLVEEAKGLIANGLTLERMHQLGLEYDVLADLIEGRIGEEEFKSILKQKIRNYLKRQLTWFNKEPNVKWFDITEVKLPEVEKTVSEWYHTGNE